jgi:hypothetical protein
VLLPGDDTPQPIGEFTVGEPKLGADDLPRSLDLRLGPLDLALTALHHAPVLLPAPDGRVGRLSRSLVRVDAGDGRTGSGWLELNQPPS